MNWREPRRAAGRRGGLRSRRRPYPKRRPQGLHPQGLHPQYRREGGFSLLELLVVMVISAVALMLASRLLLEGQSRLVHEGKRQVDPVGQLAAEQLQADLRMSTGVDGSLLPSWTSQELVLRGHPAGRVSYAREGQQLLRRVRRQERDGTFEEGERQILERTSTFRWRQLGDGTVDIELGFRRAGRLRSLTASGAWTGELLDQETRRLRVLPRGGGGIH